MSSLKLANNAVSRLAAALSSSSTTLGVMPGHGAKFPALDPGQWFPLTIVKEDGTLEIVKATARTLDTFTVMRGQEGTAAIDFSVGDRVELRATAAAFFEIQSAADNAQSAADNAQSAADNAQSAAEDLAENAIYKTGVAGAALLPEGLDAERPDPVPADGLLVRGNTQDAEDYKPEFWDRVAATWKAIADRAWVGQQIATAVQTVKDWVDQQIGFTTIYPNGGTAAAPANIAINSRYINANPFPGRSVICQAQVLVNGKWGATGWVLNSSNSLSNGVNADQYGDDIVVQTGSTQLTTSSIYDGSPFGSITPATSLQCRVLVWKLKG